MDIKNIEWNEESYLVFCNYLKSISDNKYRDFNKKLISSKKKILGIKMPILKRIAKDIYKGDYEKFLKINKNIYYEEVMLRLLIIGNIKSIEELEKYFFKSIDLIDNWALCDTFCSSLKIVKSNKKYFLKIIDKLINSKKDYYIRVGLVLLLDYYVESDYLDLIFNYINKLDNDSYYVSMAASWLLCEVFIKYQSETLEYLNNNNLNKFIINKMICKIRDSYRVDKEMKDYILKYRK